MKLRLEATPEELEHKADRLVSALAKALRGAAPDVADALLKAIPEKEHKLKHKVLQEIHEKISKRYAITLDMMLSDIGKRIDKHVSGMAKSDDENDLKKSKNPNYASNILDMEAKAYEVAKEELAKYGFQPSAFEEGGALYGESVNALREILKTLKESA